MGDFDVMAYIRRLRDNFLIQRSGANSVHVREGLLYDTTGHKILSEQGDMIDTIGEDNL